MCENWVFCLSLDLGTYVHRNPFTSYWQNCPRKDSLTFSIMFEMFVEEGGKSVQWNVNKPEEMF